MRRLFLLLLLPIATLSLTVLGLFLWLGSATGEM